VLITLVGAVLEDLEKQDVDGDVVVVVG